MAQTKVTLGADTDVAITLTGPLTTGTFRASAVVDNTGNLFMNALVGGMVGSAGTSWAAGDSVDMYGIAQYSDAANDVGGGIGALLGGGDAAVSEDVAFVLANLPMIYSLSPEIAAPTTDQDYHWFAGALARFFGGVLSKKWSILLHNNATGSVDSGNINYVGVTYTS